MALRLTCDRCKVGVDANAVHVDLPQNGGRIILYQDGHMGEIFHLCYECSMAVQQFLSPCEVKDE